MITQCQSRGQDEHSHSKLMMMSSFSVMKREVTKWYLAEVWVYESCSRQFLYKNICFKSSLLHFSVKKWGSSGSAQCCNAIWKEAFNLNKWSIIMKIFYKKASIHYTVRDVGFNTFTSIIIDSNSFKKTKTTMTLMLFEKKWKH